MTKVPKGASPQKQDATHLRIGRKCPTHQDRLTATFLDGLLKPWAEREGILKTHLSGARSCLDCWREVFAYEVVPMEVHEHRLKGTWVACGPGRSSSEVVCEVCGAKAWRSERKEGGTWTTSIARSKSPQYHTCRRCSAVYVDHNPFSEYCSWTCVAAEREVRIRRELEGFAEIARRETYSGDLRRKARARLKELAENPLNDRELHSMASDVLSGLDSVAPVG